MWVFAARNKASSHLLRAKQIELSVKDFVPQSFEISNNAITRKLLIFFFIWLMEIFFLYDLLNIFFLFDHVIEIVMKRDGPVRPDPDPPGPAMTLFNRLYLCQFDWYDLEFFFYITWLLFLKLSFKNLHKIYSNISKLERFLGRQILAV